MTPEEQRYRDYVARGGGLRALQDVDAALGAYDAARDLPPAPPPPGAPIPPGPPPRAEDLYLPGGTPVQQATDSEQIPAVRNAPLPPQDSGRPVMRDVGMFTDAIFSGLGSGRKQFDPGYYQKLDARDAAAQASDPNSHTSALARKRMAPMLTQLGLSPGEIGALSAADLSEMSRGGNLVKSIAMARAKARENEAARAQKLADRDYQETETRALDESRGNTAGAKMERAQAMAGIQAERQAAGFENAAAMQGRAFANQTAQAERNRRADEADRIEAEDRKAERERERAARSARVEIEKEYAAAEAALDALEDKLEKREADAALPGDENIASQAYAGVKGKIFGGTGRSSDDSLLMSDLDRAGASVYKITNGVANTEADQQRARTIFRGDGTTASSRQAVREQRAQMKRAQAARLKVLESGGTVDEANAAGVRAAGGGGGTQAVDTSGSEWEDVPHE